MTHPPSILTNMAFHQSRTWSEATVGICRGEETPDSVNIWRQVFRLLKSRADFDVVVTMGPRVSLAYGLVCALLGRPSKQILTEVFLDGARPRSVYWRLKTACFRWVARRARGILTNSSAEVRLIATRFGIPQDRVRFVPMHTTIASPGVRAKPDGSVISIGRTLRDLDTLVAAARLISAPVIIVSGRQDAMPPALPPNVQVYREITLAESHTLLERASVATIPLLPVERSTGQVFLFEAMALGIPVVATRCIGTADYIRDGENGLLVEPGDPQALATAICRLIKDTELNTRLARSAMNYCQNELSAETHANRKLKAIASLCATP